MSGQNRSYAVMQQRQEARDALDDFPTPMWATRALCNWLLKRGFDLESCDAREPAANRGYMHAALLEYFESVEAGDCHDYGAGLPVVDYLFGPRPRCVDWTITNPPFRLAQRFIMRALATSDHGVAMFVRTAFLEGGARFEELFQDHPPAAILQFTERVVIHKSAMRQKGSKYLAKVERDGVVVEEERRASSATAYCWIIWETNLSPSKEPAIPEFHWIPPCSEQLERPGDYDVRGHSEH